MKETGNAKLLTIIINILAIAVTIAYTLFLTNNIWYYIPPDEFAFSLITYFVNYGTIVLAMAVTMKLVVKRSLLIKIPLTLFWIAVFLFTISPTLWGLIGR